MKKIFTLSALALATVSAQAEFTFVDAPRQMNVKQAQHVTIQKQTPAHFSHQQAKRAKAEATEGLEAFTGDWVMSEWVIDPNMEYDYIASNTGITITDNGDGTATIGNFLGQGDVIATYNAESGSLEIQPQLLWSHSTYGDIWIYPFFVNDNDEVDFDENDVISLSLDSEDRFFIDNDGIAMLLVSGAYAGYVIGDFYMYNEFDRVNGTMSYSDYDGVEHELGIAWDGSAEEGSVYVYGFVDMGCPTINIDAENGTVTMEDGQAMFYYPDYGFFSTLALVEQGGKLYTTEEGMTFGTYEAETNTINLELFGLGSESGSLYDLYRNATIVGPSSEPVVGIATIEQKAQSQTTIYDLQGRIADQLAKGQLYMQQGQKFIVK